MIVVKDLPFFFFSSPSLSWETEITGDESWRRKRTDRLLQMNDSGGEDMLSM